jgi:hypothetical protein
LFVWRHKRLAGIGILYQPTLVVAPWIGDGFCCWFMIDCTIQLSIHMVRGGSIAFGTGGKHGIHDFVSVAHIWWCSCAGSPVFFAIPTLSFGTQLARFFDLLCHIYTHVVPSTPVFLKYPPTIFQMIKVTGLVPVGVRWFSLRISVGHTWVMTRPMIRLFMLFHPQNPWIRP